MGIADELITRGWCKKALEDGDGRVCLLGAMYASLTGDPKTAPQKTETDRFPTGPAWRALHTAIEEHAGSCIVIDAFNNADETTYDDVLRVAKEADEILEARAFADGPTVESE